MVSNFPYPIEMIKDKAIQDDYGFSLYIIQSLKWKNYVKVIPDSYPYGYSCKYLVLSYGTVVFRKYTKGLSTHEYSGIKNIIVIR